MRTSYASSSTWRGRYGQDPIASAMGGSGGGALLMQSNLSISAAVKPCCDHAWIEGTDRRDEILASVGRRPCAVRRLSALLHSAGGPARSVFRSRVRARADRPDDVRAVERLLHRPDREEAAQPFPARALRFFPSGPRGAISRASSARTGTSASLGRSRSSPTRPRRKRSRGPPGSSTAAVSPSRTTIRRSSTSTPWTWPTPAGSTGSRPSR